MSWLQLETTLADHPVDAVETRFEELGAVAIWLSDAADDPVLEPAPGSTPLWPRTQITALFPAETNQHKLLAGLKEIVGSAELRLSRVADRDWINDWEDSLVPLNFGKQICVVRKPADQPADGRLRIELTPGMAFGTGEHPTTAMCLEWLEQLGDQLSGKHILDYGCGTGLLAIAALKLGAAQATGLDIDPQALTSAKANAALNNCEQSMLIALPDAVTAAQHDVLIANILSNTLIECGPRLDALTAPGAPIALSGILAQQTDQVVSAWAGWADLVVTARIDDWVLLSGSKHASTEI